MSVHLLGIRHHGPGSCRNVLGYLEKLNPDVILLEGPPEAESVMRFVADEAMTPPVALLAWQSDKPQNAVFYPFAEFSPEWQVMRYALEKGVPLRFCDLPLVHSMAIPESGFGNGCDTPSSPEEEIFADADPFGTLAKIAGYRDGEEWWEGIVERSHDAAGIFGAVEECVEALRSSLPDFTSPRDLLREAWMRRVLRNVLKEKPECVAVVCGAWHVPALASMPKVKEDNELLKGLPKVKVECTWIPWTYRRLTLRSGYGAGVRSPGWYDHLWRHPDDDGTQWMSRAASILRKKDMDVSVAHVIETILLANAMAALRGRPSASLDDFNDAMVAVIGFGDDMPFRIIRDELIVSDRIGSVPFGVPKVALLGDVEKTQKRLRVPFTSEIKDLTLDLRKPNDLERSVFFHRLVLLGIDWATRGDVAGKGTFKERWTLFHKPEQVIEIIEAAVWGNTLAEAVRNKLVGEVAAAVSIHVLTQLLDNVLPADLPEVVEAVTERLDSLSAASDDILELLRAIPGLASVVRYGNVRALDFSRIEDMLQAMVARVLAGGLLICMGIDEESAQTVCDAVREADYAISALDDGQVSGMWVEFIQKLPESGNVHPLVSGLAARMLYDRKLISPEKMSSMLTYYSSVANTPSDMAWWFEGFLQTSGSVLLHDDTLWNLLNNLICGLDKDGFVELLPILKRTFSGFSVAERRQLGERARAVGKSGVSSSSESDDCCDEEEASLVIPVVLGLMGL